MIYAILIFVLRSVDPHTAYNPHTDRCSAISTITDRASVSEEHFEILILSHIPGIGDIGMIIIIRINFISILKPRSGHSTKMEERSLST
jgi:hypothetical protein